MAAKVAQWGPDVVRYVEKTVLLQTLDHLWREHLLMLEHLRQVIGLRGYGQRDPLNEYKAEAFNLFETMSQNLREAVTAQLMRVEIVQQPPPDAQQLPFMQAHHIDPATGERKPLTGDNPHYLSEAFMQDRWFLGTPADIAAKMVAWLPPFALEHFIFQARQPGMSLRHAVDNLEAIAKGVVPVVRAQLSAG